MDLSVLKTQFDNFATFVSAFGDLVTFFPKATHNVFFSAEAFQGSSLIGKLPLSVDNHQYQLFKPLGVVS